MALKSGSFAGLGKRQEKSVGVCWAENWHVRDRCRVSRRHAVEDEVTEGSWNIWMEAGECPGREYFVP
jgi:hypothetical protein